MNYTHALTISLPHTPQGYFPIGNQETLQKIYEQSGTNGPVVMYALTSTPDFVTDGISEEMIFDGLRGLIQGDKDIVISSKDLKEPVQNITRSTQEAGQQLSQLFVQTLQNRKLPDAVDALPLVVAGSQIVNSALGAYGKAADTAEEFFKHTQTADFICNKHGYFVSQAWLDKPENAKRVLSLKPATPKKQAQLTSQP